MKKHPTPCPSRWMTAVKWPNDIFIDADGVISAIAAGAVDDAYMRDKIDPMLT